jgi:hypothetical protein
MRKVDGGEFSVSAYTSLLELSIRLVEAHSHVSVLNYLEVLDVEEGKL